ncbi:MAG: hypothetical protein AW12_00214 [Candidatus Accumulibacter sp. BA-94]|nr:MAG: hypothetical protein AW12_00214 [Candidatus Accumulibacter sp. BA-94]
MGRQAALDVGLAERQPGLPQIAAVGTQDADLSSIETRQQHQAVEAVVLRLVTQQSLEQVDEGHARRFVVECSGLRQANGEVGNVQVARRQAERLLGKHRQAKVLEYRQDRRQRSRAAAAKELQVLVRAVVALRGAQLDFDEATHFGGLQAVEIRYRSGRCHPLLIRQRQFRCVAAQQTVAMLLAIVADEILFQLVAPAADDARCLTLDRSGIVSVVRADRRARDEVQAGEARLADHDEVVHPFRCQRLVEQRRDPFADRRVEAVTWHVGDDRNVAPPAVVTHEDPHLLAFMQGDDPTRDPHQVGVRDLDQFVTRIGLEDIEQRLVAMAARDETDLLPHAGHLLAQQRNVGRRHVIDVRGVQADEGAQTDNAAAVIEALDADEVEIGRTMDRRAGIGLDQDQRRRIPGQFGDFAGNGGKTTGKARVIAVPKDAEPAVAGAGQALLTGSDEVLGSTKKDEIVGGDPAEVVRRLGVRGELGSGCTHVLLDGGTILDRRAHIGENAGDLPLQIFHLAAVADAVDLEMNPRLGPAALPAMRRDPLQAAVRPALGAEQRVQQTVDGQPAAIDEHGDRIDEERHVVGDDVDDRMRRMPAVAIKIRRVEGEHRLPQRPLLAEAKMLGRRTDELFGTRVATAGEIEVGVVAIEKLDDRSRQPQLPGYFVQVAAQVALCFGNRCHGALLGHTDGDSPSTGSGSPPGGKGSAMGRRRPQRWSRCAGCPAAAQRHGGAPGTPPAC